MPNIRWDLDQADRRAARNAALITAETEREQATRDAETEYSETVGKLRERFEADLSEAARVRLARVTPAHRAYNHAVVAAERGEF
ncbi:MAG TPA: hypothetical protein VE442_08755 [Jatrophihabitans sp.]|jgi:hypothetical protein|nr:hypothetical protein [Jatrophihabitans sp.]